MQAIESASESRGRWEGRSRPVHWRTARTLYNLAEAAWPACEPVRFVERVERELRAAGPSAARRVWATCLWLDLEPLLTGRARMRFWRLPIEARAAAAERLARSPLASLRRSFERLADCAREGADPAPGTRPGQSASGA